MKSPRRKPSIDNSLASEIVYLSPAQIETVCATFEYMMEQLNFKSGSPCIEGFARRATRARLRDVLQTIKPTGQSS